MPAPAVRADASDFQAGVTGNMSSFRYKAFISYNHADEAWAKWFHRQLERYRIPGKLVGQNTSFGVIPKRLQPVFLDREELSSGSDLSAKVKQVLADSGALVVICSPAAAASRWVNEEIREFRRQGRGDRIFAVIVDGDPAGREGENCFPPALLEAEDGSEIEPLAADARKWADGKLLSLLKLLSGILGIALDSLRRRDLQRRQRIWALTTVGVLAVAVIIMLAITFRISAQKSQAAAEARRASAEQLVGFKLNEVAGLIEAPQAGGELARLKEWSDAELEALRRESGVDWDSALTTALALREAGIDFWRQGQADDAIDAFSRSWALIAEQYRENQSTTLLFELGQAEYWLGQMAMDASDFDEAERSFLVYTGITRKLLRAEPENAEWVLEMTYALSNLGGLEKRSRRGDPLRARQYLQAALQFNQIALVLDPGNSDYERELEQSHAFLADAHLQVCDLGGALQARIEGTRLARKEVETDPDDPRARRFLGYGLGGLARVQLNVGLVGQAAASLRESIGLLETLIESDPSDIRLKMLLMERRSRLLAVTSLEEPAAVALSEADQLNEAWQATLQGGQSIPVDLSEEYGSFLLVRERIARSAGASKLAEEVLNQALAYSSEQVDAAPQIELLKFSLLDAAFRYFQRHGQVPLTPHVNEIMEMPIVESESPSCTHMRLAVQNAILQERSEAAKGYTANLLAKGYYEPEFISFCREYELCTGD